jgi:hypothetical protein
MNDDLIAKLDWDDLRERDEEARAMRRMRDEPPQYCRMRKGFWPPVDEPEDQDE